MLGARDEEEGYDLICRSGHGCALGRDYPIRAIPMVDVGYRPPSFSKRKEDEDCSIKD